MSRLVNDGAATDRRATSNTDESQPSKFILGILAAIVLFGGFNGIAIRVSNAELSPFWGASLRFGGAALVLLFIVLIRRLPLPRGRALLGAVLFGTVGFGAATALGYWALAQIPAGLAQVIMALVPLFTLFFAVVHGLERFNWRHMLGALIAVGGIAVVFADRINANIPPLPLIAVVLASACLAEAGVLVKSFPKSNPITTSAVAMTAGTVMLFAGSLVSREPMLLPVLPVTWTALIYLIVVGSVLSFVLWLFVLKHWTASATSYQFVLFPFVTVAAGAWLQNETITTAFLVGGVLVLVGVYVGALARPRIAVPEQVPVHEKTRASEITPPTIPCNAP